MSRLITLVTHQKNYWETEATKMGPATFMRYTFYNKEPLTRVFHLNLTDRLHIVRIFAELPLVLEQICLD